MSRVIILNKVSSELLPGQEIVNKKGKPLQGNETEYFVLVKVQPENYTTAERAGRALLGLLMAVFTLGLACIAKKVRHFFTKEHFTEKSIVPLELFDVKSKNPPLAEENNESSKLQAQAHKTEIAKQQIMQPQKNEVPETPENKLLTENQNIPVRPIEVLPQLGGMKEPLVALKKTAIQPELQPASHFLEKRITIELNNLNLDPNDPALRALIKDSLTAERANEQVIQKHAAMERMYQEQLSNHFEIVNVPGDGDCFFYSLLEELEPAFDIQDHKKATEAMLTMRKTIADYIENHPEDYALWFDDMKQHLKDLRESSKGRDNGIGQGEFIHAKAFNEITGIPVHIYAADDPLLGEEQDEEGRCLPGLDYRFEGLGKPVRLIYNGINHWMHLNPLSKEPVE